VLGIGSRVFRVHREQHSAVAPNPTLPPPSGIGGSRFDSPDGSYAGLYFADSPEGAIAETLCRDLPLDGRPRLIPRAALTGRRLSSLIVTADLSLVAAHGAALAHLGQDGWLTSSNPAEYPLTRQWAAAIRRWCLTADGLAYWCRHDNDRIAYTTWSPPQTNQHPALSVESTIDLTEPDALTEVRRVAQAHNASIAR
jgi:RES domain